MNDSTMFARDVLSQAGDLFVEFAKDSLAADRPDITRARDCIGMAALCAEVIEALDNPPPPAEPSFRTATIDLNDFVYNAALPYDHSDQRRVWLQGQLENRGFSNVVDLANLDGPIDSRKRPDDDPIWWRVAQNGTIVEFYETTSHGS